jgi:hypothetical protein
VVKLGVNHSDHIYVRNSKKNWKIKYIKTTPVQPKSSDSDIFMAFIISSGTVSVFHSILHSVSSLLDFLSI